MLCRHWAVVSPTMLTPFSSYEPQEPYWCWGIIEADTAKKALTLAIASDDFKEWVKEARADNKNPFAGLKVSHGIKCDHNLCLLCDECIFCEQQEREYDTASN